MTHVPYPQYPQIDAVKAIVQRAPHLIQAAMSCGLGRVA